MCTSTPLTFEEIQDWAVECIRIKQAEFFEIMAEAHEEYKDDHS